MHLTAAIPYAALLLGSIIYFVGSIVWDHSAGVSEDDHHAHGTERDIKLGMIATITGLLIVALSLAGIGVHLYSLYQDYLS